MTSTCVTGVFLGVVMLAAVVTLKWWYKGSGKEWDESKRLAKQTVLAAWLAVMTPLLFIPVLGWFFPDEDREEASWVICTMLLTFIVGISLVHFLTTMWRRRSRRVRL